LKCSWRINFTTTDFTGCIESRSSLQFCSIWSCNEYQPFNSIIFGNKQLFRVTMGKLWSLGIWQKHMNLYS